MKAPSTKANIIAVALWLLGFLLAFIIPASSRFLWLSDAFLLLGFYPLLISVQCPWFWLLFGCTNIIVGFALLIAKYISKETFSLIETSAHVQTFQLNLFEMNAHMQAYHPYYVWVLIGIFSAVIGMADLLYRLVRWLISRLSNKGADQA